MTRVINAAVAVATAALLAAGCTESSSGEAAPVLQPSPTLQSSARPGGSTLPHSGAPSVQDPLPESVLSGDPCEAFTREQIEEALGDDAPQGTPEDIPTGPTCRWQDSESGAGVKVFFGRVVGQGLSSYYQNTRPQSATWREMSSVQGFPGVAFQTVGNDRTCEVVVGLADEYTVAVTSSPSSGADIGPCDLSQKLAEVVVQNLKQKAGR